MNKASPIRDQPWTSLIAKAALGLAVLWASANTVRTRTAAEFLLHTALIYIPLAILSTAIILIDRPPSGRTLRDRLPDAGFALLGWAILAPVLYSVGAFLKDTYVWIQSPSLSKTQAIVAGAVITAVLGGGLFYFRLRWRSMYGVTEAVIGIVVAAQRVAIESKAEAAVKNPAVYLAILTAGVYLVVRGLDNVHQGLTKDPIDPLATWLVKRMNLTPLLRTGTSSISLETLPNPADQADS